MEIIHKIISYKDFFNGGWMNKSINQSFFSMFCFPVFTIGYMKETRQDKIEESFFITFIETIED